MPMSSFQKYEPLEQFFEPLYKAWKQLNLSQSLEQWIDITPAKLNELKKELQKPSDNDT